METKRGPIKKEKRTTVVISGIRIGTLAWFKERALEADLPFSKYISLLLDGVKNASEESGAEGGGGNRTRQFLTEFLQNGGRERRAA